MGTYYVSPCAIRRERHRGLSEACRLNSVAAPGIEAPSPFVSVG